MRSMRCIADVRRVVAGEDAAAIRKAKEQLQHLSHGLAEDLYKQGASRARGAESGSGSTVKEGEVVDAEYAETAQ